MNVITTSLLLLKRTKNILLYRKNQESKIEISFLLVYQFTELSIKWKDKQKLQTLKDSSQIMIITFSQTTDETRCVYCDISIGN